MKRASFLLLLTILLGCGGAQHTSELSTIPLGQARAAEVLGQAIADRDYGAVTRNLRARLTNGTEVNVDVFVRALGAGFVFLNEQDRLDLEGAEIPERADASQIYALLAELTEGEEQIHLMIVQDRDFEYVPNPRADERLPEDRTEADVEARLRRDALDFLHAIIDNRGGPASAP